MDFRFDIIYEYRWMFFYGVISDRWELQWLQRLAVRF